MVCGVLESVLPGFEDRCKKFARVKRPVISLAFLLSGRWQLAPAQAALALVRNFPGM